MQNKCSLGGGNASLISVSENDSEVEDAEAAAETSGQAVENAHPAVKEKTPLRAKSNAEYGVTAKIRELLDSEIK